MALTVAQPSYCPAFKLPLLTRSRASLTKVGSPFVRSSSTLRSTSEILVSASSPPLVLHREEEEEEETSNLLLLNSSESRESIPEKEAIDYNWEEEWYPLYLLRDVPDDAPLGLTVFDRQLVLYKDGQGELSCFEDRCPHRLAKLSEGRLIDGRLECLYHGWQFGDGGKCVKIPQLPEGAQIPRSACARIYVVKESQGVVWVWMSQKTPPVPSKLPWFENFARPGFQDTSAMHELPYDHSILLENLMDPAHVAVSHDRTGKRMDALPLSFELSERTDRGFAGSWFGKRDQVMPEFLRFEAPCVLSNSGVLVGKNGEKNHFTSLFLCRPTGQGKSMLIVRFGASKRPFIRRLMPKWFIHQYISTFLEEDMGCLSSQNHALMQEKVPTKNLYLNVKSLDVWVYEYRKWLDKVGHGMPYHIGHNTVSIPSVMAVEEHAPAGLMAASCSLPSKGGISSMYAPNLSNRYFRHVIHCKECRMVFGAFKKWQMALTAGALGCTALAILASTRQWKAVLLVFACLSLIGVQVCSSVIAGFTTNFIRAHRV